MDRTLENKNFELNIKSISIKLRKMISTQIATIPSQDTASLTQAGNNFAFSGSPKAFSVVTTTLQYLWGAGVGTAYKDVEMYHHLYNGDVSRKQLQAGIAIFNNNATSVIITYKCAAGSANILPSSSADTTALSVTPGVLQSFMNASTSTVTVAAYGKVFLCGYTGNFVKNHYKFVSVRAQIKSSKSSNVYFRVFAAGENNVNNMAALFEIDTPAQGDTDHFCGELAYTKELVTLSATSAYSYRVFGGKSVNNGEYGTPIACKSPGLTYLDANYGIQYVVTINNASGKYIHIAPDWAITGRMAASLTYRINSGAWSIKSAITSGEWILSLGSVTQATVDLILPGGNYGDYLVYFS